MTDVAREYTAPEMAAWLVENGFTRDTVVKILVLGNSGVGKSFLCNAIVGKELFEHKTQLGSVTAANTFAAIEKGGVAYLICNVPGLIEVDQQNIARNKEAVETVFNFQNGCRTICLFVASGGNGGRLQPADCEAIHTLKNFVPSILSSFIFVMNRVDFEELDDVDEHRAAVETKVHAILNKDVRVLLAPKLNKQQKCFDSPEMKSIHQLVFLSLNHLQSTAVVMQPAPGAELVLDNERLKKEIDQLNTRIRDIENDHKQKIDTNDKEWRDKIENSKTAHRNWIKEFADLVAKKMIGEMDSRAVVKSPEEIRVKAGWEFCVCQ